MLASGFDPNTLRRNDRRRQRGEYARLPNRAKWIWRCTARRRERIGPHWFDSCRGCADAADASDRHRAMSDER
jgi:hypothetical protein